MGTVEVTNGRAGSIVPTLRKPRRVGQPVIQSIPKLDGPARAFLRATTVTHLSLEDESVVSGVFKNRNIFRASHG